ncbi:hypothetical protein TNCV_3300981 [Trichonephila clavipes]|nr:hypothetical protein TNCV_3300981 [Trichonephila clavipes]
MSGLDTKIDRDKERKLESGAAKRKRKAERAASKTRHENTKKHMAYTFLWITLEKGIKHGKTLDRENERRILESQKN